MVSSIVVVPLFDYIQPTHRISRYCHSMTFRQIHFGKDSYKYSFFPLAIVQWNALPENVVTSPSLDLFKAAIGVAAFQTLNIKCLFSSKFYQFSPCPIFVWSFNGHFLYDQSMMRVFSVFSFSLYNNFNLSSFDHLAVMLFIILITTWRADPAKNAREGVG